MESPFKADILKGKVAVITGGGSGIGFEISTQFVKHGASMAIMGRRKQVLDSAVFALQSLGIPEKLLPRPRPWNFRGQRYSPQRRGKFFSLYLMVESTSGLGKSHGSSLGKYINGTTLIVDGGLWLSQPRHLRKEAVKQLSRGVEKRSRDELVGVPKSKL